VGDNPMAVEKEYQELLTETLLMCRNAICCFDRHSEGIL
jgi:hypothetical protein